MLSSYHILSFVEELVQLMSAGVKNVAANKCFLVRMPLCHLYKLNNPTDDPLHLIWDPELVELLTLYTLSLFTGKYLISTRYNYNAIHKDPRYNFHNVL